jgi:hypothetical protein
MWSLKWKGWVYVEGLHVLCRRSDFGRRWPAKELAVWRRSWERMGFDPVVLGRADCGRFAGLAERVVRSRPTVNPPEYTLATSLRWWALSEQGGGLMTDYDVVNVSLTPEKLSRRVEGVDVCTLCSSWLPAVVWATKKGCRVLRHRILCHPMGEVFDVGGRPHISDMWIFNARPPGPSIRMCREFNEPDKGEPLVHVSHASCGELQGLRRSELMAGLIASVSP